MNDNEVYMYAWDETVASKHIIASSDICTGQNRNIKLAVKKTSEYFLDTHHLFVDYKAAFDSPIRDGVFAAMSELGIFACLR